MEKKTIERNTETAKAKAKAVTPGPPVSCGGEMTRAMHLLMHKPADRSEVGPPHKYGNEFKVSEFMHWSEHSRSNSAVSFSVQLETNPFTINLKRR